MEWSLIKHDLKRNKAINITLLLFMTLSAMLAVMSVVLATQTFTSINALYQTAQPPHFLQMHKGEIDQTQIDAFMTSYDGVTDWQTISMINVFGENLTVHQPESSFNLADTQLDLGLVKQAETKDLLLDSRHQRIELAPGEIAMPVILKDRYHFALGDRIVLTDNGFEKTFILTDFVLDAQMNSTLASSTRILISDEDYQELYGQIGEVEHIIEAYFIDTSEAPQFQTAYENAGMPRNGQAVTYTMMFLLSALTDIVTVFVMVLVSLLLIAIAFICLRFTIMAALEEDVHEIGMMKAIGFTSQNIRKLYLSKYRILALLGVTIGFIVAFSLTAVITKRISTTFGEVPLSMLAILLAIATAVLVYGLILLFCRTVLKRINRVTVVDALVRGEGIHKQARIVKDGLHRVRRLPVNLVMGLREVFYHFKDWMIITGVVILALLMIMIPSNVLTTFRAPEFVTYMGSNIDDILIEIETSEMLTENHRAVVVLLAHDADVAHVSEYHRISVPALDSEGVRVNLHIDSGEDAGVGLQYLSGTAPAQKNEIALSLLNADKLNKQMGDTLSLLVNEQEQYYTISGIYQDVTSGGYTAKALDPFPDFPPIHYSFAVTLGDDIKPTTKASEWSKQIAGSVSFAPMEEFLDQTLGGISTQLEQLVIVTLVIGIAITLLITVLFLQLRLIRDRSDIAILQAIGFSKHNIQTQYLIKLGAAAMAGVVFGSLLSQLLGNPLVNALVGVSGLGLQEVTLINAPLFDYVIVPSILVLTILLVTYLVLQRVNRIKIIDVINE